jgi:hypothetical protein
MKIFNLYHLRQVKETYWAHFKFGIWASMIFFILFIVGTIHAIFPFLLARYPDRIFNYFCKQAQDRLDRVEKILSVKNINNK